MEGKIIGNDHASCGARRLKMVHRVRKDRKSAAEGKYEQAWIEHRPHSGED